jgi:prophage regulatory protein
VRLLTFAQLKDEKGIPYVRRHIRDLVAAGKFPRPIELSVARIAWVESEVDDWLAAKLAARNCTDGQR